MGISNYLPTSAIARPGVIANAAARPASPYDGQAVYQQDIDGLLIWNGSAWYPPGNMPWGIVATTAGGTSGRGYKAITTSTVNTETAGIVDITDASMTFTGVAGRLYCVSLHGFASQTSSAGLCNFFFTDGSNSQKWQQTEEFATNGYGSVNMRYVFTQTGSGTIKARMDSLVAQTTVFGTVPGQGIMTLEDIGPA